MILLKGKDRFFFYINYKDLCNDFIIVYYNMLIFLFLFVFLIFFGYILMYG